MATGHITALDDNIRKYLTAPRFAVLATAGRDGMPQQSVVWYDLRGDHIMMNMRIGRDKERNLRRDPRVSFCVEDGYHYVTFRGTVEFDEEQERALEDIRALAIRYHGKEEGERAWQEEYSRQRRVTIYLSTDNGYVYEV